MNRYEAITGSAMWVAVSLLMAAAALEPVAVGTETRGAPQDLAAAACTDGPTPVAARCDGARL